MDDFEYIKDEQLNVLPQEVEELAACLTPITHIAAILNVDEDDLRAELLDRTSDVTRAYMRGKARTALELRKSEIEFAKTGSPFSVQLAKTYLSEMDADELN